MLWLFAVDSAAEDSASQPPIPVRVEAPSPAPSAIASPGTQGESLGPLAPQTEAEAEQDDVYPGAVGPRRTEFQDHEWASILKVQDGMPGNDEDGYFLLLEKVGQLRPADEPSLKTPVAYRQLMSDPKRYRAQPVRMILQYHETVEPRPLRAARIGKVFNTTGFVARAPKPPYSVVVVSRFPPPGMKRNQHFEVIGCFYKIQSFPTKDASGSVEVPVIIAYQFNPLGEPPARAFDMKMASIVVLLTVLVIVWAIVRVRFGRRRPFQPSYRPMRFEMSQDANECGRLTASPEESGQRPNRSEADDPSPTKGPGA